MPSADRPKAPDSDKARDTKRARLSGQQLMDPLYELAVPDSREFTGSGEVISRGLVDQMQLPEGWKLGKHKNSGERRNSYWEFHPSENPDAMLVFYERGTPLGQQATSSFRTILGEPPHTLKQSELQSVAEVIEDKALPGDFTVTSAASNHLKGKTVLVVEGRYHEIDEYTYAIYLDAGGDSAMVQEIFYQAPARAYQRYLPDVQGSVQSISWR